MAYQDDIRETFKENLQNIVTNPDVRVATTLEQMEERPPFAVVVGIEDVKNVNPLLDDYQFTVKILIDFYIKDDKEGFFFTQTRQQITDYLRIYLKDKTKLPQFFGNENIVGMFLDDSVNTMTESSNQCFIILRVIGSWD